MALHGALEVTHRDAECRKCGEIPHYSRHEVRYH